jgi:transcription antitermination factor NusG
MEMKWHAVYTKPNCERKVAEILTRRKFINYCPLNRVSRPGSENKNVYEVPLFSSYVFVKISETQCSQLRHIDGIINFLYWMGKPVIIEESEVDMIRRFLDGHINVKVEKTGVGINDTLSIVSGSLMEQDKEVINIKNKKTTIGFPSLGYKIVGEFEISNVSVKTFENFINKSRSKLRFAVGM